MDAGIRRRRVAAEMEELKRLHPKTFDPGCFWCKMLAAYDQAKNLPAHNPDMLDVKEVA